MNTFDLLEMASLDALGLLDPEEREEFELAFRAAPPAVQAQVRREQLRFSQMDGMLPPVEAPLGLRARVLAAVRQAVEQVAGRRVAGRIGPAPAMRNAGGVHRFWRPAAVGCAAAALVFGFTTLQIRSDFRETSQYAISSAYADHLLKEYGARFDQTFFDPSTRFVNFHPPASADPNSITRGKATLMFDPVNRRAQLFCKDFPSSAGEYEVVVVDEAGNTTRAVLTFKPPIAGFQGQTATNIDLETGSRLIIRQQGSSQPLLSSNGL